MGHQGAQAPYPKYIHFAYNYIYPRIYIFKIHIPNSYNLRYAYAKYIYSWDTHIQYYYIHIQITYIYTYFLYTLGIYAKNTSYLGYTYPIHV
jgi:hypothetical protein